jgi:hypothetical protein
MVSRYKQQDKKKNRDFSKNVTEADYEYFRKKFHHGRC